MPLTKGTSRATVSKNIKEFKAGPRNKATAKKSGKEAAQKQAIAVALKEKRKSAKAKPKPKVTRAGHAAKKKVAAKKTPSGSKRPRNRGRG
jgi:hypothetical protein